MARSSFQIEDPEERLRVRVSYFVHLSSIYTGMKYLFPGGRAAVGFTGIVLGGIIFIELGGQFPWSKQDAQHQPPTDSSKRSLRQPTSLVYQRLNRQEMCRRQDGSLSSVAYNNLRSDPFPPGKS